MPVDLVMSSFVRTLRSGLDAWTSYPCITCPRAISASEKASAPIKKFKRIGDHTDCIIPKFRVIRFLL